MDEQQFDSSLQSRPFGAEDAILWDARLRLGAALWGWTSADLQRQLLAPYPEIPSGFDLADFRELERHAQMMAEVSIKQPYPWPSPGPSPTIVVGSQRFTLHEARCEVVRRAIEFLEKRS